MLLDYTLWNEITPSTSMFRNKSFTYLIREFVRQDLRRKDAPFLALQPEKTHNKHINKWATRDFRCELVGICSLTWSH